MRKILFVSVSLLLCGCATNAVRQWGVKEYVLNVDDRVGFGPDKKIALGVKVAQSFQTGELHEAGTGYVVGTVNDIETGNIGESKPYDVRFQIRLSSIPTQGWQYCGNGLKAIPECSLPDSFQVRQAEKTESGNNLYVIDGKQYLLQYTYIPLDKRIGTYYERWHGPAQILLIPAVVFDLITSPIQLLFMLWIAHGIQ
jgi:hypothetical protein